MEERIRLLLQSIIHPAEGKDIISLGMVEKVKADDNEAVIILQLKRAKDPFTNKLKRAIEDTIETAIPNMKGKVSVIVKEAPTKVVKNSRTAPETNIFNKVIAISSCKGGVGKSTVTANLAVTLSSMGYKVGVVDTDIYGPSMPKMFNLEGYAPMAEMVNGVELIEPAISKDGIKIQSIGFFIKPTDALVWRGPMATSALKQIIHQTKWDELDFLLIDLPPGTGDVHLTVLSELKVDGAIIVSTPQSIALADVVRGIEMFQGVNINIPILGLVENMSWFTPADMPDKVYYPFGKDGCKNLAEERNIPLLGQIPLVMSDGDFNDREALNVSNNLCLKQVYDNIASDIVKATV